MKSAVILNVVCQELSLNGCIDCSLQRASSRRLSSSVKTKIVRIRNSKGIRVPKVLLEHAQLQDDVELQAENGRLIVRAAQGPRAGWAKAAKAMHDRDDDQFLDATTSSQFDAKEWRWR